MATKASTKTKSGTLSMTTSYPNGNQDEASEIIVRTYPTDVPLASVSVECSVTKNLGNYESLRIQASITLPCAVEETDSAYDEAWKRVEAQMTRKVTEVTGNN